MKEVTSRALRFAALPAEKKKEVLSQLNTVEQELILRTWDFWARPEQLLPEKCLCHHGNWTYWMISAGRGWGKTRTGSEAVRKWAERADTEHMILAAAKALDIRDIMVEGESGILSISPNNFRPKYEPSKRRLTWPNGVKALLLSADEPDTFRGPQCGKAWADELAKWPYPDAWDMMKLGLRLGKKPQCVITTTPKPTKLIKEIIKDPHTHFTRGTSYENFANLATTFINEIIKSYEGTRLGRQELHAEILDDNPGALWKRDIIEKYRVRMAPILIRIGVGVDPAITSEETSDETGIVSAGIGICFCKGYPDTHGFILDDNSGIYKPHEWAKKVTTNFNERQANKVVAETNKGGDLVISNLRTFNKSIPVQPVHATRGKQTRAEPVASLYEQGKVHHVGCLPDLEDQLCDWNPLMSESPDRLDALVWVLTWLMVGLARPVYTDSGMPAEGIQRRM